MENPHEAEQAVLLERIIKNVDKCNEAVSEMNHCIKVSRGFGLSVPIQEFLASSQSIEVTSHLYHNYSRNVAYNLEALKKLPKPQ